MGRFYRGGKEKDLLQGSSPGMGVRDLPRDTGPFPGAAGGGMGRQGCGGMAWWGAMGRQGTVWGGRGWQSAAGAAGAAWGCRDAAGGCRGGMELRGAAEGMVWYFLLISNTDT